jgi:hypothetical protein
LEVLGVRVLVQDIDFGEQRDDVALDILFRDIGECLDLLELELVVVVEEQEDAHLVGAYLEFVFVVLFSQDGLHICTTRVVLPSEQSARVFVGVELVEVADAHLDLLGQDDHERAVLGLIGPVASGKYLHIHLKCQLLGQLGAFELSHRVLRHLDVFEHHL